MSASPARVAAAAALVAVDEEGAHLEDALAARLPEDRAERDLAWFLAYGVMRRRGHVDAALRELSARPLGAMDPAVRAALRVGAFELLYARTPKHAAVHQAVETVRALGAGRAHGMVNAVLRKLRAPEHLSRADELDHPAWLVDRWTDRYGAEATERWCAANAEPPPLFLVRRDRSAPPPDDAAPAEVGGRTLPGVWRVPTGDPTTRPDFQAGGWWVQDAASVAVADLVPGGEGTRVLDACAAPGGKSFRLASRGLRVLATDRDARRLKLVDEGAKRLGLPVETRVLDWTRPGHEALGTFEAVLVDAPCSGLGTVRRHPEIRWRRTEPDLLGAAALQERILGAAASHVAPGGALIYAVCSPEPEEGEAVIAQFLATHREFGVEERLSTAPPQAGEDAHFAVRMRRSTSP